MPDIVSDKLKPYLIWLPLLGLLGTLLTGAFYLGGFNATVLANEKRSIANEEKIKEQSKAMAKYQEAEKLVDRLIEVLK